MRRQRRKASDEILERRRGNLLTDEQMLRPAAMSLARHSGRTKNDEATRHDTEEIFEHGRMVSFIGDLRTLYEIRTPKIAWEHARAADGSGRCARPVMNLVLMKLDCLPLIIRKSDRMPYFGALDAFHC